jgi:hypothetical protein
MVQFLTSFCALAPAGITNAAPSCQLPSPLSVCVKRLFSIRTPLNDGPPTKFGKNIAITGQRTKRLLRQTWLFPPVT